MVIYLLGLESVPRCPDEYVVESEFVIIRRHGPLDRGDIKHERKQSRQLFDLHAIEKALFDYTEADLKGISLIGIDDLAAEFKQDLPECKVLAIAHPLADTLDVYQHIKRVLSLNNVRAELFSSIEAAKAWLNEASSYE